MHGANPPPRSFWLHIGAPQTRPTHHGVVPERATALAMEAEV